MPEFDHVAILGPGLLGGSLGLALKKHNIAARVSVWGRRQEAVLDTLRLGAADSGHTDITQAARGADLAILCTPTRVFPEIAPALRDALPASAVITDVGSVKQTVCAQMEKIFGGMFIGSHPMAGSEKSGIAHARADLFHAATCIITPTPNTSPSALDAAEVLWTSLGCTLLHLTPSAHDEAVARLSHLPHLLAAVLALAASRLDPAHRKIAGPGFRDTTRVASGPPEMWADILLDNRAALATSLAELLATLEKFSTALRADDHPALAALLASARDSRESILAAKNDP